MSAVLQAQGAGRFLGGGGAAGAAIRAHDWVATSLGPPDQWPQALRTAVRLMLNTRHPVFIFWGPEALCFFNDAYGPSIGAERRAHALGRPGREVWAEIWDVIGPQIKQVMSGGGATWHENHLVPIIRDGRLEDVYWTYSYSPIDDESAPGGVGGVLVITTETTAQVESTRALAEDRALLQRLLKQMPGFAAVLTGPNHTFDYVNDAYVEISGQRDFLGRRVRQVFPELAGQGFFELLDRVYTTGEAYTARAVPIQLAGEAEGRFIDMLYEPIRDEAGQVSGIFVGGYEVTERMRAERALKDSELRFRAAIDAVQGILWTNSPEGELLGEQPGWAELTGQSREEYEGFGWASAVHPEDAQPTIDAWQISVAERRTFVFEHRVRRRDGVWRRFSIRAIPLMQGGEIIQWVGVHTDVTEQRETEVALRDLTATLEERVRLAALERETAMAQLHEAQKIETLGQLTAGVAHDFNNLLTPIMGGIDLLTRRLSDDERAQRIASGAMQSAERAKTLVQRLLSFGRRQTLQSRSVDLSSLVEGMRDLIERSLGPGIEMLVKIPAGLPPVEVDPNQLELALLNLCVNARDAMEGSGRVTICGATAEIGEAGYGASEEAGFVVLRVIDTGRGMDAKTLARAAEPFFTTKGVGEGTGLGLSMVYGLAAQSGGRLNLTSTPGQGTTVELILPGALTGVEGAMPAQGLVPGRGAGTILLVDDEELVRLSVADGLRELGYTVVEATSASDALVRLEAGLVPDLLLTDHMMPGMTGVALAQEARRRHADLPVLMITGYANLGPDEARALEVLAKPFQPTDLALKLAGMLGGRSRVPEPV